MKNKNLSLVLVLCICTLFACKSNEEKGKDIMKQLVQESIQNKFKGTFSYKINGMLVEVSEPTALISPDDGKQYFAGETDAHLVNIIFPKVLNEGETNTNCKASYLRKEPMAVFANMISNTVTITKKTDKLIAGTFAFELNYSAGNKQIIKITEGKFEVENLNAGKPIVIPNL